MVKVIVYRDSDSKVYGFQVSGHSDYAQGREDILCAAVSALTVTTVNSIETFTEDRIRYEAVNEEEGFLHFELETVSDASRLLLDSMVLGLQSIQESYSQFIEIRFEEEKKC